MAHAPFNFIPLSSNIYYPSWGNLISLEIPFEESYTGYVEFQITAKSPIYVRNSCTQSQVDKIKKICMEVSNIVNQEIARELGLSDSTGNANLRMIQNQLRIDDVKWKKRFTELFDERIKKEDRSYLLFSNIEKKYFIPATSLKGCFRNALEIVSYGKIGDRFSDDRYGFREMTGLYLKGMNTASIHCGYLEIKDGDIKIYDHGFPYRISHQELDKGIKGLDFENEYGRLYNRSKMSPIHKKDRLENKLRMNKISKNSIRFAKIGQSYGRVLVEISKHGSIKGEIVVTGQPGERKGRKGKWYEFVFPEKTHYTDKDIKRIKEDVYDNFIFINKNEESENWKMWKDQMDRGDKVPVFFTIENGEIRDLGFSYMYKRPYDYKISDCVPEDHFSDEMDMAECIFGRIGNSALKGRVQFTNAYAENDSKTSIIERLILSSPKASYYPFYLKQNGNRLISYQPDKAVINGWKKYPIRKGCCFRYMNNAKLDSFFIPLNKGTTFKCRMNYFNLKAAELGALLSVLTFHGSHEEYSHSIGQGKPYGLGRIKVDLKKLYVNDRIIAENEIVNQTKLFMKSFEEDIINTLREKDGSFKWNNSTNIKEFYTMSYDFYLASDNLMQYMDLKEFPMCKRDNSFLHRFTEITRKVKHPKSLLTQ